MGSRRNSSSREIPWQMLQEILLKLPTKDVARCCCVSRLWRSVVADDDFRSQHAMASHVTSVRLPEALLVSVSREPGRTDEARVFNKSSRKAMCCFPIPGGYGLSNLCNGFLCFVYGVEGPRAPAMVCNPVNGETLALPRAPPLEMHISYLYTLGFSPSTKEYKLFRLSHPSGSSSPEHLVEVDVCTLGDARRWRRHWFISPCCPAKISTPVSLDGKIYRLAVSWMHLNKRENPKRLLTIDVATESCYTYHLPHYDSCPYDLPKVGVFELNGRLWFAAHIINSTAFMTIHFWAMSMPPEDKDSEGDHQQPSWDLIYSFHMETNYSFSRPWACWLDDDEMLCYLQNETLYKYDTRKNLPTSNRGLLRWDKELPLPTSPSRSECQWNVYGGYRPNLLSPHTFVLPPSQDDNQDKQQFEVTMVSAIRRHELPTCV